ncbi:hypothetical protein ACRRTK_007420 [Alexandromys fortis]
MTPSPCYEVASPSLVGHCCVDRLSSAIGTSSLGSSPWLPTSGTAGNTGHILGSHTKDTIESLPQASKEQGVTWHLLPLALAKMPGQMISWAQRGNVTGFLLQEPELHVGGRWKPLPPGLEPLPLSIVPALSDTSQSQDPGSLMGRRPRTPPLE